MRYFVHTANSGAEVYKRFAQRLPDEMPFYVFENHNLLASVSEFEGIQKLAQRYVRALPPQPHYALGGWSFGGIIAFEMAMILQERGAAADLWLVDPYIVSPGEERTLNIKLQNTPYFQEYLMNNPLFHAYRAQGRLDHLMENNRFVQQEITHYVPSGVFGGEAVLFRMTKLHFSSPASVYHINTTTV